MSTESSMERSKLHLALPRGVTGFRDRRSEPLPETDPRIFAAICHEAARASGGRVGTITPPGPTPNFHRATIIRGEDQPALLGRQHVPLLVIAQSPAAGTSPMTFVEDSHIHPALILSAPFRLLTLNELQAPLHLADLSALAPAELEQISYWRPGTVGELIFNYWD